MTIMYKASSNDWNANYSNGNRAMSFKASGSKLFKKYPTIWGKVINIKFGSEPVYGYS